MIHRNTKNINSNIQQFHQNIQLLETAIDEERYENKQISKNIKNWLAVLLQYRSLFYQIEKLQLVKHIDNKDKFTNPDKLIELIYAIPHSSFTSKKAKK